MKRLFGIEVGIYPKFYLVRDMTCLQDVEEVTEDGAPAGRKDLLVWDTPLVDEMDPSLGRQSTLKQATRLARFLMERGIRVIVFCPVSKKSPFHWSI